MPPLTTCIDCHTESLNLYIQDKEKTYVETKGKALHLFREGIFLYKKLGTYKNATKLITLSSWNARSKYKKKKKIDYISVN